MHLFRTRRGLISCNLSYCTRSSTYLNCRALAWNSIRITKSESREAYQQIMAQAKGIWHGSIMPSKKTANTVRAWRQMHSRPTDRCV